MSEIVQFPGAVAPSDHSIANGEDSRHAQAFRDLESKICDLERWAELAASLAALCCCDQRSWHELELAVLVVQQLSAQAGEFKRDYYKALKTAPEDCSRSADADYGSATGSGLPHTHDG